MENLNTVLDESKKLCLISGETIELGDAMSVIFETANVAAASPGIVGRCGMVHMDAGELGWHDLVKAWLDYTMEDNPAFRFRAARKMERIIKDEGEGVEIEATEGGEDFTELHHSLSQTTVCSLMSQSEARDFGVASNPVVQAELRSTSYEDPRPFTIDSEQRKFIEGMFEWLVDPCLQFLRKELALNELVKTHNNMLVGSLIAMFASVVEEMVSNADGYTIGKLVLVGLEEPEDVDFEALFVFSVVWSIGASLNAEGRKRFDAFLKE